MCAIATAAATFGITFYAMTTKKDFTQIIHLVGGKLNLIQLYFLAYFGYLCFYPYLMSFSLEVPY